MTMFSNKFQTHITIDQNMITYEDFGLYIYIYIHMKLSLVLYVKETNNQQKFVANHLINGNS